MAVIALVASILTYAHEGHQHLKGTVTKLDGMRMELKSTDGKIVTVSLTKETKYLRDKTLVTASDVQVGSRVVLDLDHREGETVALEVRIGGAPKPTAGQTAQRLRCSLTGKEVDKCCCVEREGKLHCTLANKDVEKCCCSEVKVEGKQASAPAAR
jgi:hypothetical protein